MAYEIAASAVRITLPAGADLSTKQYFFVKVNSTGQAVLCAAATDKPIGVLQNSPISGGEASITVVGGTKVVTSAACDEGTVVGTDSDGKAAPYVAGVDTTKFIVGSVILASGADNELATVLVNCASAARGA
jgi:hypothetical protein